jgi:hypothetical protein
MEFFAHARVSATGAELQERVAVPALPDLCASVDAVLEAAGADQGVIYCVWGQYRVHREAIAGGVRFTLPDCPNALAWTVTTDQPPDPGVVVVHCTIARTEHDPDFVESLEQFVTDWRQGLERAFGRT